LNDFGAGIWQSDATSSNSSALSTGLINGNTAVALVEVDNAYYSGGANSDLNVLRTQIGNNGNWTGDNTNSFDLASTIPNPLPVELSSFSAIKLENGIKLNWRTETEVNNYGFDEERSQLSKVKGQTDCAKLGFVHGHGNSNSPKDYSFLDENISSGKFQYRLKQMDADGNFEYSKIIELDLGSPGKMELS
jgi:hypothetical protein